MLQKKSGLIEIPTAGGKTVVTAALCRAITGNCLILLHTKDLLIQTGQELEKFLGEEVGYVGAGQFDTSKRITVATIQSIRKYENELTDSYSGLIHDECHHASADSFYKFILKNRAPFRIGMSADPLDRHNTKSSSPQNRYRILGCFGPMAHFTSVGKLKETGRVATPTIFVKFLSDGFVDKKEKYSVAYDSSYTNNTTLSKAIAELLEKHKGQQCLILYKYIKHGEKLEAFLSEQGLDVINLWGDSEQSLISETKRKFKEGTVSIILASTIFNEGTNIPNIEVLINAAGDMAPTKQRLGRSMRKKDGPNTVIVYDFCISGNKHIEKHYRKRENIYKLEGHKVEYLGQ